VRITGINTLTLSLPHLGVLPGFSPLLVRNLRNKQGITGNNEGKEAKTGLKTRRKERNRRNSGNNRNIRK